MYITQMQYIIHIKKKQFLGYFYKNAESVIIVI